MTLIETENGTIINTTYMESMNIHDGKLNLWVSGESDAYFVAKGNEEELRKMMQAIINAIEYGGHVLATYEIEPPF